MEMSPEKIDDARIWGGLLPPAPSPPGSYAYGFHDNLTLPKSTENIFQLTSAVSDYPENISVHVSLRMILK